jgi:hypothetical protein
MHTKFVFIIDSSQVPVDIEKCSVKLNATKVNDGVCGENRDRLWRYINWYDVNITCKLCDMDPVNVLLRDVDNDDAGAPPLVKSFGALIHPPNQKRTAYALGGVIVDDWEWSIGGRTERASVSIPMRAVTFVQSRLM